ncbi:MqnA/MqnD/SBP family protein [Salipiger abyssi]|uniref:4,5-dihydroxyphthalate decarboxylase n=1 Tax=Salipiger abyssi TaxID=1250539 RepID=A0A1P8UMS2_9RHOB|nr:MqnA/MqnD/SBP family protein [Salipiger abyssi]APZ50673.1 4,5-dihydroxyphthalate decarboxylase [Salipiger abyssi]
MRNTKTEDRLCARPLRVHLVDRPNTRALLSGRLSAPGLKLEFCHASTPPQGFRRMVREGAYDISELPLMTFLQARAMGRPLTLLPAVVMGRFQHRFLAARADERWGPEALRGKRIAARSYSVTTVTLVRAILWHQYGIAPEELHWLCTDDSHVDGICDPPHVQRLDAEGRSLEELLLDGTVDAAVLGREITHPGLRCVIADPDAAARDWVARTGVMQINHIVAADEELVSRYPEAVRQVWQMLGEAARATPRSELGYDVAPFGLEANRKSLEFALDCAFEQGLTPGRLELETLIHPALRDLV